MTAQFNAEEILEIAGGRLAAGLVCDAYGAIETDTRTLKAGDWYLALVGERFDGHDFLGDAFAAGASGAIVAERPGYAIGNPQFPLIAVEDTLAAYHALARNWRRRIRPFVVAVTGSSGKTTTKEMCAAAFNLAFRIHKSRKNENNEIGVAKSILTMPDDCQVLILEMAMRGLGQIDQLARFALPDLGIITNAGTAHLELLGTVENIARAKCELLAHLPEQRGAAIIGAPSDYLLAAARKAFSGRIVVCEPDTIEVVEVSPDSSRFRIKGSPTVFSVNAHGRPLLEDAWCAVTAARMAKVDDETIAQGLSGFEPVSGRGNRLHLPNGALLLDETYNANPDSVRASVSAMLDAQAYPYDTKIVVLGELAELGCTEHKLHQELGAWLQDKKLDALITVGAMAKHAADGASGAAYDVVACDSQQQAEAEVRRRLTTSTCVLVKGSRRANLDKLVGALAHN
jgi:UDP-N-acetylmuramoyl-tripeptide--D-alanyl-D-alanine ligase